MWVKTVEPCLTSKHEDITAIGSTRLLAQPHRMKRAPGLVAAQQDLKPVWGLDPKHRGVWGPG